MSSEGAGVGSIDIVIITSDRYEQLTKSLESLFAAFRFLQSKRGQKLSPASPEISIRLGFNGSSPDFESKVQKFISAASQTLPAPALSTQSMTERNPGAARNRVLSGSKARWIFFCDDDVIVPENLFLNFLEGVRLAPDTDIFGGPNLNPETPDQTEFERAQGLALGSKIFAGPMHRRYKTNEPTSTPFTPTANAMSLCLCNLFWRRSEKGPQSETPFRGNLICGEELTLINESRRPYMVSDSLAVFHYRRKTVSQFFQQAIKYGIGRGQAHFAATLVPIILAATLGALVAHSPRLALGLVMIYFVTLVVESIRLKASASARSPVSPRSILLAGGTIHLGYSLGLLRAFSLRFEKLSPHA